MFCIALSFDSIHLISCGERIIAAEEEKRRGGGGGGSKFLPHNNPHAIACFLYHSVAYHSTRA